MVFLAQGEIVDALAAGAPARFDALAQGLGKPELWQCIGWHRRIPRCGIGREFCFSAYKSFAEKNSKPETNPAALPSGDMLTLQHLAFLEKREARTPFEVALTIFRATLPPDHPCIMATKENLANWFWLPCGRFQRRASRPQARRPILCRVAAKGRVARETAGDSV